MSKQGSKSIQIRYLSVQWNLHELGGMVILHGPQCHEWQRQPKVGKCPIAGSKKAPMFFWPTWYCGIHMLICRTIVRSSGPLEFSTPNESPGKKAMTFEIPTWSRMMLLYSVAHLTAPASSRFKLQTQDGFSKTWALSLLRNSGNSFWDHQSQSCQTCLDEPCRKREIISLCRITLLAPDLTQCLRDNNFDLRGMHLHIMTYAKLTLTGLT